MRSHALSATRAGLVLVIGIILACFPGAGQRTVGASTLSLSGVLTQQEDGTVSFDNVLVSYGVVGAIDFTPFLGFTVQVIGPTVDSTLFVQDLSLGAITLHDDVGVVEVTATGAVDQNQVGFQMTVSGITFDLVDDGQLGQYVGQTVSIEGQLIGPSISVTSVTP